jgi:hypothetical protein
VSNAESTIVFNPSFAKMTEGACGGVEGKLQMGKGLDQRYRLQTHGLGGVHHSSHILYGVMSVFGSQGSEGSSIREHVLPLEDNTGCTAGLHLSHTGDEEVWRRGQALEVHMDKHGVGTHLCPWQEQRNLGAEGAEPEVPKVLAGTVSQEARNLQKTVSVGKPNFDISHFCIMSTEQATNNTAAGGDSASTDHAAAAAQSMSDGLLATVAPPLDQMKSRLTELQ